MITLLPYIAGKTSSTQVKSANSQRVSSTNSSSTNSSTASKQIGRLPAVPTKREY